MLQAQTLWLAYWLTGTGIVSALHPCFVALKAARHYFTAVSRTGLSNLTLFYTPERQALVLVSLDFPLVSCGNNMVCRSGIVMSENK